MNKHAFLESLRRDLKGLPKATIEDILSDYSSYFSDALADGRDEASVCAGLGDPAKLAQELKAENRIKKWETQATPNNFARMFIALIGVGTVNAFLMVPLLITLFLLVLTLWIGAGLSLFVGLSMLLFQVTDLNLSRFLVIDIGGNIVESGPVLSVLGFGSVCMSLVWLWINVRVTRWMSSGLIRYVRLNYRLVNPGGDQRDTSPTR